MKYWKNIALTALVVVMLAAFGALTPSPAIEYDAYEVYQGLNEE